MVNRQKVCVYKTGLFLNVTIFSIVIRELRRDTTLRKIKLFIREGALRQKTCSLTTFFESGPVLSVDSPLKVIEVVQFKWSRNQLCSSRRKIIGLPVLFRDNNKYQSFLLLKENLSTSPKENKIWFLIKHTFIAGYHMSFGVRNCINRWI